MPLTGLVLLRAAEGGGGGLTDVNFGLALWTVVLFGLFAWVLAKFGWKPLLRVIEEREKDVREAVLGAEKANAEAHALLEKHKEMLREAGREREEIVKRTLKEAEQLRQDLLAKSRAESEELLKRAKDQIAREKTAAIQELRAQVADIAIDAAAKLVTSSLSPEVQRKLVDDYIADLPKAR
jgi:F-type H+-transporting ATPase subunit b